MAGLGAPRPLTAGDFPNDFDCGRETLNHWLRRHGWRNQQDGISRTSVVCDRATGAIAGYVALSAAEIQRAHLPKPVQRNRPESIPAVLLGQLAVDRKYQGQGVATSLMSYAFRTSLAVSTSIGCFGILTHPLDDRVRELYRRFGFKDLPFDPKRGMIVRLTELPHNGFALN